MGVGNIGFKLSLRLIERGAKVKIYRRDIKKLNKICELINFIKPVGTSQKVSPFKFTKSNFKKFDIIISCAKGLNIMNLKNNNELNENVLLLDVGKGMFDKNTLKNLIKSNFRVFRLDIASSLDAEIENTEILKNMEQKKYDTRKVDKYTLVTAGLLGQNTDIIVDDVRNPKKVFGVCDGKGDFVTPSPKQKDDINKILYKAFKKKGLFR